MINFTQLPDWIDDNIWMDKIMLSGLEGTYAMIVDKEGYITDTRLLTDYEGNNLPEGTLWLPTSRFRSQFRELWSDFSMDSYMHLAGMQKHQSQTRLELANIIKLANRFIIVDEDVWIKNNQADDRTFDHPYLYHYSLSRRQVIELTKSITVSIYHIYNLSDNKVKIIFNVTDLWMSLKRPEWNPRAQMPFSVLFG